MNALAMCALLFGADPEPERRPKAELTIPKVADVTNASVVAISADGALAAGGFGRFEDCQVAVFDRRSGEEIYRARQRGEHLTSMAFSRDARYLAVSTYMFGNDASGVAFWGVYLIDLKAEKVVKSWDEKWFAFSPTADHLYLTGQEHIEVIELPGLKSVQKLPVPHAYRLAVSRDGKTVAALHGQLVGDQQQENGFLSFVDVGTRRVTVEYSGKELENASALAFSPEGRRVATGYEKVVRVWPADQQGKPRALQVDTPFHVLPLWLDEDLLALVTQRYRIRGADAPVVQERWADMYLHDLSAEDSEPARWRFEWAMDKDWGNKNAVRFALSADGRRLVAGCNGLTVFNLITRKTERTFPAFGPLNR